MVSVIVPNYNHASFLRKRLESIVTQKYTNFECIMLDDASTDDSICILEEYVKRDSRFKLYINEINSGSTFAQWNYGVSLSKGKFIWIAESDDYAEPEFLNTLISNLENDPKLVLAYSHSALIDASDNYLGEWIFNFSDFNTSFKINGIEFIQKYLLYTNVIPNASAVVFLRESYLSVGQAIPALKNNGDWHLWLKILTTGKVYFTTNLLNHFRHHGKSVTYLARERLKLLDPFDFQIIDLRNQFNHYLASTSNRVFHEIVERNNLFISYEWGNYGIYLKENGRYFSSFYFIIKASFYPRFKTYYLKKYIFGYFYNHLFQK